MQQTDSPATDFSVELLAELVRRGVRHMVVAPGSRSQALALVAAELERVGAIELHVRIDERVAGFLALGLALESGAPAVVVTTSGTAVANLHPAVLEAHEARVPMIVVTADRPAELRGIRSNQTTTQSGVFLSLPRTSAATVSMTSGTQRKYWKKPIDRAELQTIMLAMTPVGIGFFGSGRPWIAAASRSYPTKMRST